MDFDFRPPLSGGIYVVVELAWVKDKAGKRTGKIAIMKNHITQVLVK